MKQLFRTYVIEGILMIALGVIMLVWPTETRAVYVIAAGAVLALMGLLRIVNFFAGSKEYRSGWDIVTGLLQIAAGVILILYPSLYVNVLPVFVGVLLGYGALVLLIHSIVYHWGFRRVLGVIFAIILSGIAALMIINPAPMADFMTMFRGAALIIEGIFLIIIMVKARRRV